MSCAPPAAAPNPTVPPAAATEVGAAGRAVSTAPAGIGQPTISAAQTQVSSSAQGGATALVPTVQSAQTPVSTTVVGVATQGAPTVAAARTETAPAAAAVGTSAASTAAGATAQAQQATSVTVARAATATAVAPTAQALATRVAPTVQAAATQGVAAMGTAVATSPVHVTNVNVGATDTMVTILNGGSAPMNLAGWTLIVGPDFSVELSDITLKAGQTRQLHFSQGTDTDTDVYLGFGNTAAKASLQPGARVVLIAPPDQIASVYPVT